MRGKLGLAKTMYDKVNNATLLLKDMKDPTNESQWIIIIIDYRIENGKVVS